MEALTPLEVVLKDSHEWSIQRMHSLCTKAEDLRDVELLEDAESIRKEKAVLPEVSEPEVMRHFVNLSVKNHHIDKYGGDEF